MTEFTVVNPRKRSRSNSVDSDVSYASLIDVSWINEDVQSPLATERKMGDNSGLDSDKENSPKTPVDGAGQVFDYYEAMPSLLEMDTDDVTISELDIYNVNYKKKEREYLYEPSGSLLRDDTEVSEILRIKKYDTKPPPTSRAQVLAAAYRCVAGREWVFEPETSDTESGQKHKNQPTPKRRKKIGDMVKTDLSPKRTMVNGRTMITPSKLASKMQKLVHGFPLPQDPFPENFTLTELCVQYPNHLFGDNLLPFLQCEWTAAKIAKLLPDQSHVEEKDRVTSNAIASRMRKTKLALEKSGQYTRLMNGPKTHVELWNNVSELGSSSESSESEDEEEETEVAETSGQEEEWTDLVESEEEMTA